MFFSFPGLADGDIDLADRLLQPCLVQYPRGALFLFYAGRIHEIRGEIDEVSTELFPLQCYPGLADGDIDLADRLLQPCLVQYPRGALYAGCIHEIRGEIDEVSTELFPLPCYPGLADGDIDLADRLLQPCLVQYPRGALFLRWSYT